ncbi:MAG: thioredoxin family protein [bacterium]|nr:thioredoxin family protein [bacterium]
MRRFHIGRIVLTNLTLLLMLCGLASAQENLEFSGFGNRIEDSKIVQVRSVLSVSSVAAGRTYEAAVIAEIAPEWHINSSQPHESFLIPAKVAFDTLPGITPRTVLYPPAHDVQLIGELMSVYEGNVVFKFKIDVASNVAAGNYVVPVRLRFQPCDNNECRGPQTVSVDIPLSVGELGAPLHEDIFGAPVQSLTTAPQKTAQAAQTTESVQDDNEIQKLIDKHGFWGYLIALGLAFVTGLLLSFSPCTYPMIPITVSIFAGQQRSLWRGFVMSLFYVGSMAVVYGIMGLIVSLVGGVFGAWLASPAVVIGIAIVFVIFSLSMFGVYELQVPASLRNRLGRQSGGGIGGAIVLGVVAALVVSPCVGPFVAGILLYIATAGSPVIGFLVLFVFAIGLGTLYIIIGTFSSAISALPGSGGWMEQVKKFFGFVLLLMAIYFLKTIVSAEVTALVTALLLLALGVFGGGLDRLTPESGFFLRLKKFVGILALIVGVYLLGGTILRQGLILPPASEWLPTATANSTASESSLISWSTDMEAALAQAKSEGKPVLIDTWATWCVNCKILEKKTFGNQAVADEAQRFVALKVQLENSDTPITKDFMARFGLKHYSLPTTLLLDSSGNVKRILQGVVEPDDMIAEMRKVS